MDARPRGIPEPYTRRLRNLAKTFLDRRYFDINGSDKQQIYYYRWRENVSLENVFNDLTEKPLIEYVGSEEYEIVDGWGRLLPFVTLLIEGHPFHPVDCFVAWGRRCETP